MVTLESSIASPGCVRVRTGTLESRTNGVRRGIPSSLFTQTAVIIITAVFLMWPCFLFLLLDLHTRLCQCFIHRMPRALERAGNRRDGNLGGGHLSSEGLLLWGQFRASSTL